MPRYQLQLWPGYETTIGRYENNILLCAEISTKVMRQETVLTFLNQCANDRSRNPDWIVSFMILCGFKYALSIVNYLMIY